MGLKQLFEKIGNEEDYAVVLDRFCGNEALLKRFVTAFPDDPTFGELEGAVASQNYMVIETAAHTLKGVASNLGFTGLHLECARIVDCVRNGEQGRVTEIFEKVQEIYRGLVREIKDLE